MTYHLSTEQALKNAGRFVQEAGTQAVKLEGGVNVADKVKRIVECGIPVMGHIGLTPQSINQIGGHKIQGNTPEVAASMLNDARALDQAGVFAIVLETVPAALATLITQKVSVPTIGIGAGVGCDGQVQIINDILGSHTGYIPKHAKQYAKIVDIMSNAIAEYKEEVTSGKFPTEANSFPMDESILEQLKDK
jgi:3-methyl-2-oxobutanoate hydroxymethyltransferase